MLQDVVIKLQRLSGTIAKEDTTHELEELPEENNHQPIQELEELISNSHMKIWKLS